MWGKSVKAFARFNIYAERNRNKADVYRDAFEARHRSIMTHARAWKDTERYRKIQKDTDMIQPAFVSRTMGLQIDRIQNGISKREELKKRPLKKKTERKIQKKSAETRRD